MIDSHKAHFFHVTNNYQFYYPVKGPCVITVISSFSDIKKTHEKCGYEPKNSNLIPLFNSIYLSLFYLLRIKMAESKVYRFIFLGIVGTRS